ncbi:uncharacterized protein PG998_014958 [Apiospora kogelbergensis]|uniref:uncharacterized protein n=1 Tax=Apiospora kogelbergensis TaxID=1337665 RepID=UPI00313236ED
MAVRPTFEQRGAPVARYAREQPPCTYKDVLTRAYMARQWLWYPPAQAIYPNSSSITLQPLSCICGSNAEAFWSACTLKPQAQELPGLGKAQTIEALAAAAYLDGGGTMH